MLELLPSLHQGNRGR